MKNKSAFLFLLFAWTFQLCEAQEVVDIFSVQPKSDYENVLINKIYTDSLSTCFIIWVKKEVKPHKHMYHTESILVLEGEAEMQIEGKLFSIKQGSFVTIIPNTKHSVRTTSLIPLKVLSIQSPEFDGTDRIQVD